MFSTKNNEEIWVDSQILPVALDLLIARNKSWKYRSGFFENPDICGLQNERGNITENSANIWSFKILTAPQMKIKIEVVLK